MNTNLSAIKTSSLDLGVLITRLEDERIKDFPQYFWSIARPTKGDYAKNPFVKTPDGTKLINMLEDTTFCVISAYRGFFKTDSVLHRAIHLAITQGEDTMIFAETDALAEALNERILNFMNTTPEMDRYRPSRKEIPWNKKRLCFVDKLRPITRKKWNKKTKSYEVVYEERKIGSIFTSSYKSKSRGGRSKNIILDDIVTEGTSSNISDIKKLREYISTVLIPMVNSEGGRLFLVGTPQHKSDYLNELLNSPEGMCDKFFLPIRDKNGKMNGQPTPEYIKWYTKKYGSIFRQGEKWFKEQVIKMDHMLLEDSPFVQKEYFLKIKNNTGGFFHDMMLNKNINQSTSYGAIPKGRNTIRIIGIDPMGTLDVEKAEENKSDYATAMVLDYNTETHNMKVLEIARTRDLEKWEDTIKSWVMAFEPDALSYEGWGLSNVIQDSLLNSYSKEFIIDTKSKNKIEAIINKISIFSSGMIELPYQFESDKLKTDMFFEELKNIQDKKTHDDICDSFVRCVEAAKIIIKKNREEEIPEFNINVYNKFFTKFKTPDKKPKKIKDFMYRQGDYPAY